MQEELIFTVLPNVDSNGKMYVVCPFWLKLLCLEWVVDYSSGKVACRFLWAELLKLEVKHASLLNFSLPEGLWQVQRTPWIYSETVVSTCVWDFNQLPFPRVQGLPPVEHRGASCENEQIDAASENAPCCTAKGGAGCPSSSPRPKPHRHDLVSTAPFLWLKTE